MKPEEGTNQAEFYRRLYSLKEEGNVTLTMLSKGYSTRTVTTRKIGDLGNSEIPV